MNFTPYEDALRGMQSGMWNHLTTRYSEPFDKLKVTHLPAFDGVWITTISS